MDPISGKHQIGAVLAGIGAFLLFRHALASGLTRPNSPDRLVFMGCVLIASVLLGYAWGVPMTFVARAREWTPRGCRAAGYPLWALGMLGGLLAVASDPHVKPIADAIWLGGCTASLPAARVCRMLVYPELGWSGKAPAEPSLSINPGPRRDR